MFVCLGFFGVFCLFVCLFVFACLFFVFAGCLTSQQHASVSQGRICAENFTCCHTETEAADPTFYLTHSQYTDTEPTSPSADPMTPGAWQGEPLECQFLSHWYMTRPGKIPSQAGLKLHIFLSLEADALTTRPTRRSRACMHHKVVGNFGSEADVRSLYYRRFRFNDTSDVGACTHSRPAK